MFARRFNGRLAVAGVVLFLAAGLLFSAAQAREMVFKGKTYDIAEPGEYVSGEVIVQMTSGMTIQQVRTVAEGMQGVITGSLPEYRLYRIRLTPAGDANAASDQVAGAVRAAKAYPGVKAAFPNHKMSIPRPVDALEMEKGVAPAPDDASTAAEESAAVSGDSAAPTGNQWHLDAIHYNYAGTVPASTPIVAVIDTGVDYNHPDLVGRVILGYDYVDDDADPMDMNGHGTHVSGIIAGTGTYMIRGISPNTKILAVRAFNALGSASTFDIMSAVVYARKYAGVKILNMSFGGYMAESTDASSEYMIYKKVLDDTVALGVLPVVAAGNEDNYTLYQYQSAGKYRPVPAWFPGSFTVGATQEVDTRAYFSNYNVGTLNSLTFNYTFVDIVAPGWNVLSSYLDGQVSRLSGTSMATPVVAGCAARYWGVNTTKTLAQVESALAGTGKSVDVYYGFPTAQKRIDLMKAMGKSQTGFVGVVYNGQTGLPLKGAKVTATLGTATAATGTTNNEGFFTLTGLTGAKSYTLAFTKAGFANYSAGFTTTSNQLLNLTKPVFLNQNRASGQWSLLFSWRSMMPGYYEAYYTWSSQPAWFPYNWDGTAGTYFNPIVASSSLGTVSLANLGSLTQSPYMALTHYGFLYKRPGHCIVIKPQSGQTYKVYTRLDSENDGYYEWGKYKTAANVTQPGVGVSIYLAGTQKATVNAADATGTGTYWNIGTISGTTFTKINKLQASAP